VITRYTHTDDTTIWELSICTPCMPRARLIYLDVRIRAATKAALWGLLIFATGAGAICLGPAPAAWAQSRGLVDFLAALFFHSDSGRDAVAAIVSMAFCFLGVALAIFGTAKLISFSMSRSRMTDRDVVPVEWIERCFVGEFNRILEMRKLDVSKEAKENQGDTPALSVSAEHFPLPGFMEFYQLPAEERKKAYEANGGTPSERQWQLIGVYDKTPQDLIADPSAEWRKIMAEN
jgi:hypothetical protein